MSPEMELAERNSLRLPRDPVDSESVEKELRDQVRYEFEQDSETWDQRVCLEQIYDDTERCQRFSSLTHRMSHGSTGDRLVAFCEWQELMAEAEKAAADEEVERRLQPALALAENELDARVRGGWGFQQDEEFDDR